MQEGEDLLDHINKVKALADQLACLEVPMRDEDVVMTLLESLSPSYKYLITALETLPMKNLIMEFVTARLMHEVSKKKEKELQGDAAMEEEGPHLHTKTPRHVTIVANRATLHDFASRPRTTRRRRMPSKPRMMMTMPLQQRMETIARPICKWIMDSGATKHMTPHRATFDMYEVIPTRNVHMGDDTIVEAIGMGSILVEVMVKGRTKRIRIKDVLHVPKLHANLLSMSKILSSGCKVQFNMEECKPIGTPLDVNSKLLKLMEEEFQGIQEEMQGIPYKVAVGSSMYAMVGTRPDLAFPMSMVVMCVIHVKGWSFPLDGGETHHAVLEGHFGLEIVPWRQGC
jgi:hypothetical protein